MQIREKKVAKEALYTNLKKKKQHYPTQTPFGIVHHSLLNHLHHHYRHPPLATPVTTPQPHQLLKPWPVDFLTNPPPSGTCFINSFFLNFFFVLTILLRIVACTSYHFNNNNNLGRIWMNNSCFCKTHATRALSWASDPVVWARPSPTHLYKKRMMSLLGCLSAL